MTHLRILGALTVAAACLSAGVPIAAAGPAEPRPIVRRGDLTFTSATLGAESVLAVEAPGVRLEKRATSAGAGTILLAADGNRIVVSVTASELRVARAGHELVVQSQSASAADFARVRALLRAAPAVQAAARLQGLMGADGPTPLVSALAFVGMLAGDTAGMRRIADARSVARPGIRLANDAYACWSSYSNSINLFFIDLESCIYDNRWNIVAQHGCSFVYVVQAEVAWFSLIACSGGLPVQ